MLFSSKLGSPVAEKTCLHTPAMWKATVQAEIWILFYFTVDCKEFVDMDCVAQLIQYRHHTWFGSILEEVTTNIQQLVSGKAFALNRLTFTSAR